MRQLEFRSRSAHYHRAAAQQWSRLPGFQGLKDALTSAPVLKLPDPAQEFTVMSDASAVGIGAVFMQADRVVAYEGRKLTDAEVKWSTTEQEMLGVVFALSKWRCYLEGRHFKLVTDHQPNDWFDSQQRLSPRQARWYEHLRSFHYTWVYRPGRINVADPLSRSPAFLQHTIAAVTRSSTQKRGGSDHMGQRDTAAGCPVIHTGSQGHDECEGHSAEFGADSGMHTSDCPAGAPPISLDGEGGAAPALPDNADPANSCSDPILSEPEAAPGAQPPVPLLWNADATTILDRIWAAYVADPLFSEPQIEQRSKLDISLRQLMASL